MIDELPYALAVANETWALRASSCQKLGAQAAGPYHMIMDVELCLPHKEEQNFFVCSVKILAPLDPAGVILHVSS